MRPKDRWTGARERSLERVRDLVLRMMGRSDAAIYLFGSCARGGAASNVDLVDLSSADAGFRARILKDAVVWRA